MPSKVSITASYAFFPLSEEELPVLQTELKQFGIDHQMKGLVLIAPEGINSTVSGSAEVIAEWKQHLTNKFGSIVFKDSSAERQVFRRWSVKVKTEIVTIKKEHIHPHGKHKHVSPQEWHQLIQREDVVVVDARNAYEYAIGKFSGAMDPKTKSFHEFPDFVASGAIPKDKKVMMYCTGGIRCEKAIYAMEEHGYNDVVQLEGGILAYLQQFPHGAFEGECFVFDHRVAVNQELKPSQVYGMCPHCGDPGDVMITCDCSKEKKICASCHKDHARQTCSKACANERKKRLAKR